MAALWDVISAAERATDLDRLKSLVHDAAGAHGYDCVLVFSASAFLDELLDGIYWIEGIWFDDEEAPDAETYVRHCPITRHILDTSEAFFWTKSKGKHHRVVTLPRGPGFHGLQVPVFGHTGLIGAVTFGGQRIDAAPHVRFALIQLGVTAFHAARRLLEGPPPEGNAKLSGREREVLRWIASGRRVADVAATLGLSERTVENHLRHIRHRLQVTTTAQAISTAVRTGAIRA